VAQGDKLAILSSGFEVRQKPMPFGMLPAPANVSAEAGGSDGEIIVKWDSVKGARSYIVEESFDISDPENWAYQATVTKTKCYISGMESGIRIWVRVVAVNAAGQGAYSDVATKTVP